MEERVGSLELERDLFKADASKLKEDLTTCVERMFDISNVAGDSGILDGNDIQNDNAKGQRSMSHASDMAVAGNQLSTLQANITLPAHPKTVIDHTCPSILSSNRDGDGVSTRLCIVPNETRQVIRRTPTHTDPIFEMKATLDLPRTVMTQPRTDMNPKNVNAQRDAIFRRAESFRHTRSISSRTSLLGSRTTDRLNKIYCTVLCHVTEPGK